MANGAGPNGVCMRQALLKRTSPNWSDSEGFLALTPVCDLMFSSMDSNNGADMTTPTLLDWAEKAAVENLKERLANLDLLRAQASSLLQLILVGIGGALTFAIKVFDSVPVGPLVAGALATVLWLCWVAAMLVWKCLATSRVHVVFNHPRNLYNDQAKTAGLDTWRERELQTLGARIDGIKPVVESVGTWLDHCRYAAIATPLLFTLGAWVV